LKKVIVIGCPGAGKSVFARRLKDRTKLPLYHLDMLWHKADRTTVTRDEFDGKLKRILAHDSWIIDGNYLWTMPTRLKECDTVFLLDYPLDVCLAGAKSRIGQQRDDMPWVETEFDADFKQWITDFSEKQLPQIYQLLSDDKQKEIHIFKSRADATSYLRSLSGRG